jgi:hypothetical protein
MNPRKKILLVNVLYWVVGALLYPIASMLPSASGQTPKVYSLLIPLAFIGLAFGSTSMIARALEPQKSE